MKDLDLCLEVVSRPSQPLRYNRFDVEHGGTAAAAPPPFRPGNPALCGSHPLVTPYYCKLGDLQCFRFICQLIVFFLLIVYSVYSLSTLVLLVGSSDL